MLGISQASNVEIVGLGPRGHIQRALLGHAGDLGFQYRACFALQVADNASPESALQFVEPGPLGHTLRAMAGHADTAAEFIVCTVHSSRYDATTQYRCIVFGRSPVQRSKHIYLILSYQAPKRKRVTARLHMYKR